MMDILSPKCWMAHCARKNHQSTIVVRGSSISLKKGTAFPANAFGQAYQQCLKQLEGDHLIQALSMWRPLLQQSLGQCMGISIVGAAAAAAASSSSSSSSSSNVPQQQRLAVPSLFQSVANQSVSIAHTPVAVAVPSASRASRLSLDIASQEQLHIIIAA